MKKLIEDNELGLPISTALSRSTVGVIKRLVGIDRLNSFYASLNHNAEVVDFVSEVIEKLGLECSVDSDMIRKIPQTGPVVVVSNFPHGGIDGLVMLDALLSYRKDTKILADSIFAKAKPLDQAIIGIEDLDHTSKGSLSGLRAARRHLKNGGVLVLFPSQSVATYRRGFVDFGDDEWNLSLMKFIASTSAPVVPAYISGRNSLMFHLIHKLHHRLGTIRLVREVFNKEGAVVSVSFGEAISVEMLSALSPFDEWRRVIVANIVLLQTLTAESRRNSPSEELPVVVESEEQGSKPQQLKIHKVRTSPLWPRALWPEKQNDIAREIKALHHSARLMSQGVYDLYLAPVEDVPQTTLYVESLRKEMAVSRHYKFRVEDDPHSRLIICWDREQSRIAAAVRVGYGDEIFERVGVDGFYCNADFDFSHKFLPLLQSSIEVGQWVVADGYVSQSEPRWLLWRGEMSALMRSEKHDYLLSVVRICSSRSLTARRLIVNHMVTHYYKADYQGQIVPRHPVRSLARAMFDPATMQVLNRRDLMQSFIRVADPMIDPMSPMIRRYIQVGGEAVGVCLGRDADRDSVYALAMVDVAKLQGEDMELFHVEQ